MEVYVITWNEVVCGVFDCKAKAEAAVVEIVSVWESVKGKMPSGKGPKIESYPLNVVV